MTEAFAGLTDADLREVLRETEEAGFPKDEKWCRMVRQELKRRWVEADELRRRGEVGDGP